MAGPIEVGRIPRGRREELRICVETLDGAAWVSCRVWERLKGEFQPGRVALAVPAAHITALRQAIEAAEQAINNHRVRP